MTGIKIYQAVHVFPKWNYSYKKVTNYTAFCDEKLALVIIAYFLLCLGR